MIKTKRKEFILSQTVSISNIERIIFLLTLVLSLCVQSSSMIDSLLVPRYIILSFGLLVGLFTIVFSSKKADFSLDLITCSGLIYTFLYLLSCTWATVRSEAFFQSTKVFIAFIFFCWAIRLLKADPSLYLLATKVLIFVVLVYSFIGLKQFYSIKDLNSITIYEISSISGHKNLFACFLFLCIGFLCYGLVNSSRYWNLFIIIILSLVLFLLVVLKTRAVWIGFFITTCSCFCIYVGKIVKDNPVVAKKYLLLSLLLLGCLVVVLFTIFNQPFSDALVIIKNAGSSSVTDRFHVWNNTILLIKESPFLGVGAGNWQFFFQKFSLEGNAQALEGITFQRPHNDFLWVFSEVGALGGIFYIIFWTFPIFKSFQLVWRAQNISKYFDILGISSILLGFLFVSFFDFPRERIEILLVSHLLLAFLYVNLPINTYRKFSIQPSFFYLLILSIGITIMIGYKRVVGEHNSSKIFKAKARKDWNGLLRYVQQGSSLFYKTDPSSMPLSWYEGLAYANFGNNKKSIECLLKARKLSPYNHYILNNLGVEYFKNNQISDAKECFLEAIRINPRYDESRLNLVLLYYTEKEYSIALKELNKVDPNSTRAVRYKSILEPLIIKKK